MQRDESSVLEDMRWEGGEESQAFVAASCLVFDSSRDSWACAARESSRVSPDLSALLHAATTIITIDLSIYHRLQSLIDLLTSSTWPHLNLRRLQRSRLRTSLPTRWVPGARLLLVCASVADSRLLILVQTDLCISNAIVKTGVGFGAGVLLSVLLFRREYDELRAACHSSWRRP